MDGKRWWYPTAFSTWGDEERSAIARVIESGQFTQGAEVAAFEREFAEYHGCRHAIMVNSGSSANLIAVSALVHLGHIKRGDQALVPALAWSTTYAPLIQHGLRPVLLDCDDSWNAEWKERTLDDAAASLIVACSVLGNPAQLVRMEEYATGNGIPLLNDNCESLGASIEGSPTGDFGLMSTASLFYSHQISAIEGGVIVTDDDECFEICRMLRAHGWTRDLVPAKRFEDEYDFRAFGYNVRGLEMHAAIAREQLRKLPAMVDLRRRNLRLFWELAAGLPLTRPLSVGHASPFGIHFGLADEETRAYVVAAMRAQDIDCRLPTGGSFRLHEYGKHWRDQKTPVADHIHRTGLFLGNGAVDLGPQIERAISILKEIL